MPCYQSGRDFSDGTARCIDVAATAGVGVSVGVRIGRTNSKCCCFGRSRTKGVDVREKQSFQRKEQPMNSLVGMQKWRGD